MVTAPSWIWSNCEHCGAEFGQPYDPGRRRRFCSGACRTAAYRARKRHQQQEQQRQERWRRAYEDGYRRAYEEAGRHQRQRARSQQPPPHAGTSRPGTWCGPCGGIRGPHTFHHDDAAHQRARRRYEGLRAKAASTSFPHEADACRAKADALRDKYGL
jgi:Protein of unknown function (DUF2786)